MHRPVTGQVQALQRRKFDDSFLSYNSSWTDNDSNAEGDADEIAFSDENGDKGHATLPPVCSTTLFNNNRIPASCQMERDVASIPNGIWPGSHNITLLTHSVVCHFAGDWNSYLPFTHGADSQLLENPPSAIRVDNWCSWQSNGRDVSVLPSSVVAECALGCRPAVRPEDLDGNSLCHNLCNKTDADSVESPPLIGLGTVVTAASCCAPPRKVSLAKFLSGHPNICTMFLMMHARTPAKAAAAQVLEAIIALQETEDATQVKLLQALQLEFSMVARIKYGLKEKGVSWFSQESELGPSLPGDSMAITPTNLTPAGLVMGAKYRWSSNPDKLTTQLNKQTFPTTWQSDLCSSASAVQLVGRLVQQSDP